jgi:membrane associated rhomboid family serine protease
MRILQVPATALLIAANVIVFLLMQADRSGAWSSAFLVSWGGDLGRLTLHGEPWRLLTAMFVHGSVGHIAGNLVCLLAWGSFTEIVLGTRRFLLAYFTCGILADLASAVANPNVVSVGASGAIAGILGLMVVIWLKGAVRISPGNLVANIALNGFLSFLPAVDWTAHLAGFAVGAAIGPLLFRGALVQKPPERVALTLDQVVGPWRRPRLAVSFREPMSFPAGTKVYRARSRLVALLPDETLVADDGAGGFAFDDARAYRDAMGDESDWALVKEL